MIEAIRDSVDCNLYFFGSKVETGAMYAVLIGAIAVFIGLYMGLTVLRGRKAG